VAWRCVLCSQWPSRYVRCAPALLARRLTAALHSLVAHAVRLLCTLWPVWGSNASVRAMAWPGVACLARSGLQSVPATRQRPLHGASPQLCTPWLRTPSACCARICSCGALMRLRAQWRGLKRCGWPAMAFKVCPLRASPTCTEGAMGSVSEGAVGGRARRRAQMGNIYIPRTYEQWGRKSSAKKAHNWWLLD